jgi:cysteine-rich repeat protein
VNPRPLVVDSTNLGDTSLSGDTLGTLCGTDADPDDVWTFTAATAVHLSVVLTSATVQSLAVRPACDSEEIPLLCTAAGATLELDVAAGETVLVVVYADAPGPYALAVTSSGPRCGDGNLDAGEECEDGNTTPGDGCGASCRYEVQRNEVEPNDDGIADQAFATVNTNDFNDTARANADAFLVVTSDIGIRGAIGAAGDEDSFAIQNTSSSSVSVDLRVWTTRIPCPLNVADTDTVLSVFDTNGARLTFNDDENLGNGCSALTHTLAPGEKVYAVVSMYNDNIAAGRYELLIDFH